MTRFDSDPDLDRLGEALRASTTIDLAREARVASSSPASARTRLLGRRGSLAGGTLGLAGIGAALFLALGTSATPAAFAVTREDNGSVLVTVNPDEIGQPWVLAADQKLASMGIDEAIEVTPASGAATVSGPVSCQPGSGGVKLTPAGYKEVPGTPSGPPIKVLFGTDGTGTIPSGNTGAGTAHLASCIYYTAPTAAGSGNSGTS